MTTPPVMSLIDEIVAELELACEEEPIVELGRTTIRRLLSERAELKRDAERYRFLRDPITNPDFLCRHDQYKKYFSEFMPCEEGMDAAIDSAMTP